MLAELKTAFIVAATCPTAPPGMQAQADTVTGWVKWVVTVLFAIAILVSIGALLFGRMMQHARASQMGSGGLAVCLVAAVLYVTFPGMVTSIIGSGCG